MSFSRRRFIKSAAMVAGAMVGPWSLAGREARAAVGAAKTLSILTRSEYNYINAMAREIIPDEPVLNGQVDVAGNIDRFFAMDNSSPDFLVMLRFLRLIRMADPVLPLLRRTSPFIHEDVISFKRTICFLGYYSDANGEAEISPAERVVWPRIGYGGPKDDDWWPPDQEVQLDPDALTDRIKEEGA